jgi:hypothetical protein
MATRPLVGGQLCLERGDHDEQVHHIVDCLDDAEIRVEEQVLNAEILGILPGRRQFEARLESGETIHGRIDRSLEDVPSFKQDVEGQMLPLRVRVVKVRSNLRYVLLGWPDEKIAQTGP